MTNYESHLSLLDTLCKQVRLRLTKLLIALDALEDTIRNDLDVAEEKGLVMRVLAEIVLKERSNPKFHSMQNSAAKRAFAREAAVFVDFDISTLLNQRIYFLSPDVRLI